MTASLYLPRVVRVEAEGFEGLSCLEATQPFESALGVVEGDRIYKEESAPQLRITGHIHSESASRILRQTCEMIGFEGVSTHSFRRTALTQMSNAGIPLRIIQEVSGHRNLEELQKYLEVRPEQVKGAVASLSMLGHIGSGYVRKSVFPDVDSVPDAERVLSD